MDPKFQSSFIPKGSLATGTSVETRGKRREERSLISFLALVVFIISVLLALGMFGYKYYLKYSIERMSADLENARVAIDPELIKELTDLDNRIISVKELVSKHKSLTPLFEFLEISTPRTLRFIDFSYAMTEKGPTLTLRGEARGYATLALLADIFNRSGYFKDPVFSNLSLNERGDVGFSFISSLDPTLLSYQRDIEGESVPAPSSAGEASSTPPTI